MEDLREILQFNAKRQFLNCGKSFLEILEKNREYIKRLEKLLTDAGFEDFEKNNYNYEKDRAIVLSKVNDGWRELNGQLELFEVNLRKK